MTRDSGIPVIKDSRCNHRHHPGSPGGVAREREGKPTESLANYLIVPTQPFTPPWLWGWESGHQEGQLVPMDKDTCLGQLM